MILTWYEEKRIPAEFFFEETWGFNIRMKPTALWAVLFGRGRTPEPGDITRFANALMEWVVGEDRSAFDKELDKILTSEFGRKFLPLHQTDMYGFDEVEWSRLYAAWLSQVARCIGHMGDSVVILERVMVDYNPMGYGEKAKIWFVFRPVMREAILRIVSKVSGLYMPYEYVGEYIPMPVVPVIKQGIPWVVVATAIAYSAMWAYLLWRLGAG